MEVDRDYREFSAKLDKEIGSSIIKDDDTSILKKAIELKNE